MLANKIVILDVLRRNFIKMIFNRLLLCVHVHFLLKIYFWLILVYFYLFFLGKIQNVFKHQIIS